MKFWHNVYKVIARELRLMRQRPVYLLASVAVMAFCSVFFLTFLGDGIIHSGKGGTSDRQDKRILRAS